MTENEIHFRNTDDCIKKIKSIRTMYRDTTPSYVALSDAIQALEEIQQYRAIGTVEEFKKCKEELELYRNLDKTNYHDGYRSAIDDVVCKISDYKEKHYHNREEYPINYGLLCDMENWFLDMKGE